MTIDDSISYTYTAVQELYNELRTFPTLEQVMDRVALLIEMEEISANKEAC